MASASRNFQQPQPPRRPAASVQSIKTGYADSVRGFTRHPNEYDHLATMKDGKPMFSGVVQQNVLYWIERKTLGDPARPEWARVSITALAQLLGGVERKTVAVALADLIKRGIIAVPDREGCAANAPKMYKLTPEKWRDAPPYSPALDEELLALAKKVEAGWAARRQDDEDEDEDEPIEVKPGRVSRPRELAMPVKDAEPFKVRIVYNTEFDVPMSFRARAGRNGRLQVTACRPRIEGKEKANPCSRTQPHGATTFEESKGLFEYSQYLSTLVLDLWGTAPDEAFVKLCFDAAAGAPVGVFANQVKVRFRHAQGAETFQREARKHQPGLLVKLAEQAARTHAAHRQREKETANKMPTVEPQRRREPLDAAKRWDRIRRALQTRITPESYSNWFERTSQLTETASAVMVEVEGGQDAIDLISSEYSPLLSKVCMELGEPETIVWKAGR
jgi:hypothetical protein